MFTMTVNPSVSLGSVLYGIKEDMESVDSSEYIPDWSTLVDLSDSGALATQGLSNELTALLMRSEFDYYLVSLSEKGIVLSHWN